MDTEKVACNFCHGGKTKKLFSSSDTRFSDNKVFTIVECQNCGLIYVNPRPTEKVIYKYYPQDYWDQHKKRNRKEILVDFGEVYRGIKKFKPKPGRILDVGCGRSELLYLLKKKGWEVVGLDLSERAIKYAHNVLGIEVINKSLEEANLPENYYDVIVYNHVLEHLPDPLLSLKKSFRLLKKDGILIITVPNPKSVNTILFGKNWFAWEIPRHLYHYPPKTLKKILLKLRFKILRVEHYSLPCSDLNFRESLLLKIKKIRKIPFPKIDQKEQAPPTKKPSGNLFKSMVKYGLSAFGRCWGRFWSIFGKGDVTIIFVQKTTK